MNHVKNFYDTLAPGYDSEQESFAFVRKPEMQAIRDLLPKTVQAGDRVLEIGAGTGRFTCLIAPLAGHVTAVDLSGPMLDLLAVKVGELGLDNVSIVGGDFMEQPLEGGFDVIVSFSAIEYIRDSEKLFARLGNLLRPGGRLLVTTAHNTVFRMFGRVGNYFRQKIFMRAYSFRRMRKLLEKNGFHSIVLDDIVMKSFFTGGILLVVQAEKKNL